MVSVERKVQARIQIIQHWDLKALQDGYDFIVNLIMKYGGIIKGAPFSTDITPVAGQIVITMVIYFDLPNENVDAFEKESGINGGTYIK